MSSHHERLDAALDARRLDLDLSWKELAVVAKTSEPTLRAFRSGMRRPTGRIQRRIEDALRWEHGSIDAILEGGDPTPVDAPANPAHPVPSDEEVARQIQEAREMAARLQELLDQIGGRREDRGGRAS